MNRARRHGFTLVELLVVVTLIVLLLALLAPALDSAIESAQRAVCASNLDAIHGAMGQYGMANRGRLVICRGRRVNHAFDHKDTLNTNSQMSPEEKATDWPAALASVGLAGGRESVLKAGQSGAVADRVDHTPAKVWNCPSRVFKSRWDVQYGGAATPQMLVGYHYYGGTRTWINFFRSPQQNPAKSPSKLSDPGGWALASDATGKFNNVWSGEELDDPVRDLVPHNAADGRYPAGHNQVFMDGSAQWFDADRLLMIHSWNNRADQLFFFWQADLDGWTPGEDDSSWLKNQK